MLVYQRVDDMDQVSEIVWFIFPVMEPEHIEDNIDFAKRTP